MEQRETDLGSLKLIRYIFKRAWIVLICAALAFAGTWGFVSFLQKDTFAASGTLYVNNSNPNLANYQYVSSNDLSTAVQLLDTYIVIVKSDKVMDTVAEKLSADYPGIENEDIRDTLSMASVSDTGVLKVTSETENPQLSVAICNTVLNAVPSEIVRVVGGGTVEVIDYAKVPDQPVSREPIKKGLLGAAIVIALALPMLLLLFSLNKKVESGKQLKDKFGLSVMSCIRRTKGEAEDPSRFLLNDKSSRELMDSYAKLRMKLMYYLNDCDSKVVAITSSISGEGKSTISANLALSCAMNMKDVLLLDADMRRGSQSGIFSYSSDSPGLAEVLTGTRNWKECLLSTQSDQLHILPSGALPDNPAELLSSLEMEKLLDDLKQHFSLILIDVPPINIVPDPLNLSDLVAGCIFVVRENFSDHREIQQALENAKQTKMNVFGFAFYGEHASNSHYYGGHYYNKYYGHYYGYGKEGSRTHSSQERAARKHHQDSEAQ